MKKIGLLLPLVLSVTLLTAQQDLTLYELRSVPQANQVNVSRTPYANGYVLLPGLSGIYGTFYNEGFNVRDMSSFDGDSTYIDMEKGLSRMKDLNDIGVDFRTVLFGFGFRTGASYITFNVEEKISARLTYPKSLFELVWLGNAHPQNLDNRVALDGFGLDYMQYTEMSLGWAKDLNEKISFGLRAKYLSGHANFKTTNSKLGFTTSSDAYSLALDGQFAYQSAGAMGLLLDSAKDFNEGLTAAITGNHGGAIDLGFTYRHNHRISLSAAVNDIGMINWQTGVQNGTSDSVGVNYEGIEVNKWAEEIISPSGIFATFDTLYQDINFEENNDAYTTWLPTKIYLGANYRLFQKTDVSLLSYNEFYNGKLKSSLRVGATQRVRNWLMASINYSVYGRSFGNIGVGLSANAGPVQLYMVTDNVLSYMFPLSSKNFHLRAGINLTFSNNFSQN